MSKYRKYGPEITPYLDTFHAVLNNSTEHEILQLDSDISNCIERGEYTLRIFINLSMACDTVDHEIFISKLQYYRIKKTFKMAQKLPK